MQRSIVGFFLAVILSLLPAFTATAAQDEVLLAKMKVVREIDLGSFFEYEVETEGRGRAILKTAPFRLKVGEAINLFVVEGTKENGKPAYMALTGGEARSFKEGFAAVRFGGGWSLIDKNGRLIVQGGFEKVRDFNDGFAFVEMKKGYAFLGKDGKILNTPLIRSAISFIDVDTFDRSRLITGFNEGFAVMRTETTEGRTLFIILDKTGAVTRRLSDIPEIDQAWPFSEGLSPMKYSNKWGYINTKGDIIIPGRFDFAYPFKEGMAAVMVKESPNDFNGKWGFIDKGGNFVVKPNYEYVESFSEGLAAVKIGGKWGFIGKNGNVAVNMSYDEVRPFSDGIAAVKRGHVWGCIDKNGQVVVKFLFSKMGSFVNGLAPAVNDSVVRWKWGYIDKKGNFVIKPQYESAEPFSEGLAVVSEETPDSRGAKWKYINTKGQAALWFYMYR